MATFKNALGLYNLVDTIELDCGAFSVELPQFSSVFKELGDEMVRLRAEGILPKVEATPQPRKRMSRTASQVKPSTPSEAPQSEFILGSLERDQRFFAEHVMVNWHDLKDDTGAEVEFTVENVMELFAAPGGMDLYAELLMASMDVANFVGVPSLVDDVKNS